ncbi:uncharacterized protein LOC124167918 [Ischnura elegans]|uniref:uncharacterized protein LOC124167918 n=1 Tax=Ischnura elegans TaxID=197161 RepID=UPI001ED88E9F|nr:uncharacterized protein LOC124167918 [Ischnura elegans]
MKPKSTTKCTSSSKSQKDDTARKRNADSKSQTLICSRDKLDAALKLIKDRIKAAKGEDPVSKIQKCKSITGAATGSIRLSKNLACSTTHKCVQLRNALISHNWKEASILLLNMLKDPKDNVLYINMWKAFFVILQHSPHADLSRMEQFRDFCRQLSVNDTFLDAVYLQ